LPLRFNFAYLSQPSSLSLACCSSSHSCARALESWEPESLIFVQRLLVDTFPSSYVLWPLLALFTSWSSASVTEVDLLFPRNDTYAPTVLMPLVFAIQGPAANSLNLALLWQLSQLLPNGNISIAGSGVIPKSYLIIPTSEPYYQYTSFYNSTTIEGTWQLFWALTSENCTQLPINDTTMLGYIQENILIFTIKNGAQATDLVAATADNVYTSAESFSFNVTGTEKVSIGSGNSVTSCAVVAPMSPTASPNPCAAQLNSTGASSISASLTASAYSSPTSLVSCLAKKSAGSIQVQLRRPIWVVATLGWLLYTTIG
jgi:hypothetical protein